MWSDKTPLPINFERKARIEKASNRGKTNEEKFLESCDFYLTLALMMVGRGSRIPCIFLKAGMTKRLHVTTADTGLPGPGGGGGGGEKENMSVLETSLETIVWFPLSLYFTHYLGGQRWVYEHRPCPTWRTLSGDWYDGRREEQHGHQWTIHPPVHLSSHPSLPSSISPWFHEDSSEVDLGMQINIQHLFQIVLKKRITPFGVF